jgi:hypothetical protein
MEFAPELSHSQTCVRVIAVQRYARNFSLHLFAALDVRLGCIGFDLLQIHVRQNKAH